MARIRSTNTTPELRVRRMLHHFGYRYRLHRKDLPGKPDIVFAKKKKIILVNGCFWHLHDCKHLPRTNVKFWEEKLHRNKMRDWQNQAELRRLGWSVLVVWECETRKKEELAELLVEFLSG